MCSVTPVHVPETAVFVGIADASDMDGLWISRAELKVLPNSGVEYKRVLAAAKRATGNPILHDGDKTHSTDTLAAAYVSVVDKIPLLVRAAYEERVKAVLSKIGKVPLGRVALEPARELAAYVIAADVIGYRTPQFEADLRKILAHKFSKANSVRKGGTIVQVAALSPNNHGTMARASVAASALYLSGSADKAMRQYGERLLADVTKWHLGWLGDKSAYSGFVFEGTNWHANPKVKAGINALGATINGKPADFILPEDQRRSGEFIWPVPHENYVHEGYGGALTGHLLLYRAGRIDLKAVNDAIGRAYRGYVEIAKFPPTGDDIWITHAYNHYWGGKYKEPAETKAGRQMGWTSWSHASN